MPHAHDVQRSVVHHVPRRPSVGAIPRFACGIIAEASRPSRLNHPSATHRLNLRASRPLTLAGCLTFGDTYSRSLIRVVLSSSTTEALEDGQATEQEVTLIPVQ